MISADELKLRRLNDLIERNKECNEYIIRTEYLLDLIKLEHTSIMQEISTLQSSHFFDISQPSTPSNSLSPIEAAI